MLNINGRHLPFMFDLVFETYQHSISYPAILKYCTTLRLRVMHLILNIIFSGVIVILAYKSTTAFHFTSWLLSVMNKGIKDINCNHDPLH